MPFFTSWSTIHLAWSTGIAKPSPMLPLCCPVSTTEGGNGGVDADELALKVDQRATGVAGVDGRVGLNGVEHRGVRATVASGNGTVQGADDAGGHGAGQSEWLTNGNDALTDLQVSRRSHLDRHHVVDAGDADDGQVRARVAADDLRVRALTVGEVDGQRSTAGGDFFDDVVVRQDQAVVADDDA